VFVADIVLCCFICFSCFDVDANLGIFRVFWLSLLFFREFFGVWGWYNAVLGTLVLDVDVVCL